MKRALLLPALLLACAAPEPPPCPPGTEASLWVRDLGWHTELGVARHALPPALRDRAGSAPALALGFGKAGFFDATEGLGSADLLLAPLPGPAVLELRPAAPPPGATLLPLPDPAGLAAFLAASLPPGPVPPGRFVPAARNYDLSETCNAWVAEGLSRAGLPVSPAGVVLAGQVMRRAAAVPGACRPVPPAGRLHP